VGLKMDKETHNQKKVLHIEIIHHDISKQDFRKRWALAYSDENTISFKTEPDTYLNQDRYQKQKISNAFINIAEFFYENITLYEEITIKHKFSQEDMNK
jgi:hypothetical protein